MKKPFNEKLSVDAGLIAVMDLEWVRKNGGEFDMLSQKLIEVPTGTFKFKISISAYKDVEESSEIETSGRVVVGDPCYSWTDNSGGWNSVLRKTDFFEKKGRGYAPFSTGGDGDFLVHIVPK